MPSIAKFLFTVVIPSMLLLSACETSPLAQKQENSELNNLKNTSQSVMTAVNFLELVNLKNAGLSPDGKIFSYVQEHVNWKKNKYTKQSLFINIESKTKIAISNSKTKEGYFENLKWSPDSQGFLTYFKEELEDASDGNNQDAKKKSPVKQIYYYSLSNKALTQLTNFKKYSPDINNISWAPDAEGFYYTSPKIAPHADAWEQDKGWVLKEYESNANTELHYFSLKTKQSEVLISGNFTVSGYEPSSNGKYILYSVSPDTIRDSRHSGDLYLYALETQQSKRLTQNAYAEYKAQLSPDNKFVAYKATVNWQGEGYYEDNLFLQQIGHNAPQLLLPNMAIEIDDFAWSKDNQFLYIRANVGLSADIYQYHIATKKLTNLTGPGQHDIKAWFYDAGLDQHIIKIADASSPGDYYSLKSKELKLKPLTFAYTDLADRFLLPKQEVYQWLASDGTKLEGLLVYPIDYQVGKAVPLVTITHGGPRSAVHFGAWNTSRYVAVLAGQGYAVFLPNHRGGTGYGDKFMRSMVGNYWRDAHTDVLAGIDSLVEEGIADTNALIKQGWSAGGHMTNKLITVTDRFKAAASGAGASDWVSMYGESDIRYGRTPWFGGSPWEQNAPLDNYRKQSPLKDAWKVKTPTLFWVGEKDVRVPATQSILMYRAVKAAGADSKLYIAPGEPHNYRKPRHKLFKINKELEWYAQYLDSMDYTVVMPQYVKDNRSKGKE